MDEKKKKKVSPPSFLHVSPHLFLDCRLHIGKKVSVIAFRQILPKFACGEHFQFHNHDLFQTVH